MSNPLETVVFLGPSLPREVARSILHAEYRPPARKGDVYAVLASGVRRVVVIDGVFHATPSVWQRELLTAIDDGIEVLGAASMGALRAAELCPFGVRGVGTVFGWYRDGVLDGDDEVALHHATDEHAYRPLSVPLVNIRATLGRAVADGLLSRAEEHELIALVKRAYYPERTYRALLACPVVRSWPAARRDDFARFVDTRAIDIKAEDAREVLAHCARHPVGTTARPEAVADPWPQEFARTALGFRTLRHRGRSVAWTELRAGLRRRPATWRARVARITTDWCLEDLARRRGVDCAAAVVRAFAARHHRARDPAAWARQRGLTSRDYAALLRRKALVAWLRAAGPSCLGIAWDRDAAAEVTALARRAGGQLVRGDDAAFLAGWLADHGFATPRAERQRRLGAWRLGDRARRDLAPGLRTALDQRIAASWLLEAGLRPFGPTVDVEVEAVLDHQFVAPLAALYTGGRPS